MAESSTASYVSSDDPLQRFEDFERDCEQALRNGSELPKIEDSVAAAIGTLREKLGDLAGDLREKLFAGFLGRLFDCLRRAGKAPVLEEYLQRYSDLSSVVRQVFYDWPRLPSRYEIESVRGKGGQATVYLARDRDHDEQHVAIKVFDVEESTGEVWRRFKEEVWRLKMARHRLVVPILDDFEADGCPCIVLQYIKGETLKEKLKKEGPMKPVEAARMVQQLAEAIEEVHTETGRGTGTVVHGDLKPGNIIIDDQGRPRILDFGLAALTEKLIGLAPGAGGTFEYMSPEQATAYRQSGAGAVDPRSDVWAIGSILFEALTGEPPLGRRPRGSFSSSDDQKQAYDNFLHLVIANPEVHCPAARSRNPHVPPELDAIVQRCLDKKPGARIQTAGELAVTLKQWLDTVELLPKPWDFSDYITEKLKHFSDRRWIFDEIDAWPIHKNERTLLLTGDFGTGKTAVVGEFVRRYAEEKPWPRVLGYHFCQFDTPETIRPSTFVRSLAAMLRDSVPEFAAMLAEPSVADALSKARCEADPRSSFQAGIVTPLNNIEPPHTRAHY